MSLRSVYSISLRRFAEIVLYFIINTSLVAESGAAYEPSPGFFKIRILIVQI